MGRRKRRYAIKALLSVILATGGMCGSSVASDTQNTQRRFEVRDSIEMAYFGTPILSAPDDQDDDAVVSPDGRHFVKLTHRGALPGHLLEFHEASVTCGADGLDTDRYSARTVQLLSAIGPQGATPRWGRPKDWLPR